MKSFCLSTLLLVAAAAAAPSRAVDTPAIQDQGNPAARASLVSAIDAWRTAVIKGDRAGLERAYHPDLSYGHTDGALLTKTAQIDRTLQPGHVYTAVDEEDLKIRIHGKVAYVTATWTFHLKKDDGTESAARLSGLDAWTKEAGHWQLIARQLTRPSH